LQPEPLRAVAGARCPGSNPPKGLLYNHMSKTGGTTMKEMLMLAMGVVNSQGNVTLHNVADHIKGNDKSLGKMGALIIQDDINKDLQTTSADASNFFVLGVVRRPCDYLVSTWAWSSMTQPSGGMWGTSPPFDTDDDLAAFTQWLDKNIAKRDEGENWYGTKESGMGAKFMTSALDARYQDPNLVHCWVRTHSMTDDLKKCMAQYGSCGGNYKLDGLDAETLDEAHAKANTWIKPTETAKCSTFFKNATLMKQVMASESSLISKYNLGSCCSS